MVNRLLCLLISSAAFAACTARAPISERVGAAIRQGEVVNLAKLTDFAWDQAFVFSPFTPRERICKKLEAQWPDCGASVPRLVEDGTYLLVFAQAGKVVHHEMHPRANGDFCSTSCTLELLPASASFRAVPGKPQAGGATNYALFPTAT